MSALEDWASHSLKIVGNSGDEIIADCPWCGTPKLYLNLKKEKYICYKGCSAGAAKYLIAFVDNVSVSKANDRIKNYKDLESDLNDELASIGTKKHKEEVEEFRQELPEDYVPCFDGEYWRVPTYASAEPPNGRGLSDDDLLRHGIGYVGAKVFNRWRARLIIPVFFGGSKTFVARLMGPPEKFSWENEEGETVVPQRYLYPKGADVSKILYWGDHIAPGVDLVVVEGVFDCIRLVSLGFPCVATFGKQMSATQVRLIAELKPKSVTVLYDDNALSDSARAAFDLSERIPESYYAQVSDGDPDIVGFYEGRKGIKRALKARVLAGSKLDSLELELQSLLA